MPNISTQIESEGDVLPTHLGIILDGNRRWAKSHNLPTLHGHQKGVEVFKEVSLAAFDRGVRYVSAFLFSTDNWQRTKEEVGYLMKLFIKAVENHLDTYNSAGVKLLVLGRRDGLDTKVLQAIEKAESSTADNTRGTLAICFNYGGKEEIVDAVKSIINDNVNEQLVTKELINKYLYKPEVPGIDLLIRTSGENRTSGFMMYRTDYAELYFTDVFWPDFNEQELNKALIDYSQRKRRFGK